MKERKRLNITANDIAAFILKYKVFLVFIVIVFVSGIITKGMFFRWGNLSSVSRQIATPIFIALGCTVLISSGGIDLSIGELVSLSGIIYAILALRLPTAAAILITIAISVLCGAFSGFISLRFKLPPFIVTLAMAQVYTGAAYILCNGKSIGGMPDSVKALGQGLLFGKIPVSIIFAVVAVICFFLIIRSTKFGRHVLATGGNEKAAMVSGINVSFVRISAYCIVGLCCACGSIIMTGRVAMALPTAGAGLTMDAIAAVAIGGTSMKGGKASIIGTLIGCIIMGIISNVLNLANVSSFYQWICKGLVILFAVILDTFTESFFSERQRKAGSAQ